MAGRVTESEHKRAQQAALTDQLAAKYSAQQCSRPSFSANAIDAPMTHRASQSHYTKAETAVPAMAATHGVSACAPFATDTNARVTSGSHGGMAPRQFPWSS